jgi:uncharacterized protein (TIGR02246 family)
VRCREHDVGVVTQQPDPADAQALADLYASVRRLTDIEAVRQLKARYCAACDDDHDPDAVVALFQPGGRWSTSLGDTMCDGLDAIRSHFRGIRASGRIRASTHMVTNPLIEIDGDRATARWSFTMMYTGADTGRYRILGFYDDVMERAADGWRFRSLHSTVFDYVRLEAHDPPGR